MTKKYFIQQYILGDTDSFETWVLNKYNEITANNKIIGYLFSTTKIKDFVQPVHLLNLYLIKKDGYHGKEVSQEALAKAWDLFLIKSKTDTKHNYVTVFRNPPIEQWLDTKENWCKKVASDISKTFGWLFEESLSEVYTSIMKLYNKGSVYLGNLNYVRKSIYNYVLMNIRANKIRLNGDNINVYSLDTVINSSEEEELTLGDMIATEAQQTEESLEYKLLLKQLRELLSKSFSNREIDQILTYRPNYLPMQLYRRLLKWRESHKIEDLYE